MRIHWSIGLHSSGEPHGRIASDVGYASLVPLSFVANERQTYSTPFVRSPISAVVSVAAVVTLAGHVDPLSSEHSKRNSETLSSAVGGKSTRAAWSSAVTAGFAGAAGGPNGVTGTGAGA